MHSYPLKSQWLDRFSIDTVKQYRPDCRIALPEKDHALGIIEGLVQVVMHSSDGRVRSLMVLHAGCLFGEQSALGGVSITTNLNAIALTKCTIGYISGPSIIAAVSRDPSLILELMQHSAENTSLLLRELERIAFSDSLTQIAIILMEHNDHNGTVPFSQERLAQIAGKTRVTVASALHRLREMQVIRLERARILVIDQESLYRLALGYGLVDA
ncbi:Crp/Fnr family transcriptional regulator [Pseudomonas sp. BF-RE-26]|uniref:Crp/Fnr family transcriptional regulator n=1 Tax=Pseudomonas sp. BF-RE-26 TaxID=2832396 RepID=UPI001CBDE1F3|nr:Crp/Fnr family transcriptional regulator [Pseudomonas sp. BF-RE-26]